MNQEMYIQYACEVGKLLLRWQKLINYGTEMAVNVKFEVSVYAIGRLFNSFHLNNTLK